MKWDYKKVRGIKVVYQAYVWRTMGTESIYGIHAKVFWNYLFPMLDIVATDKLHIDMSKGFWRNIIGTANVNGLHVYHFDLDGQEPPKEIKDNDNYHEAATKVWSPDKKYVNQVIIISKDPLK